MVDHKMKDDYVQRIKSKKPKLPFFIAKGSLRPPNSNPTRNESLIIIIIKIFLLLPKALLQTYRRTAIRWGWIENLLGQSVV